MNAVLTRTGTTDATNATSGTPAEAAPQNLGGTLIPLAVDIAIPLGSYYLMRDALGLSLVLSLGLSSVVPAVRTIYGLVRERDFNALATLMLVVNVLGIVLSFSTGDARLMLAKDSVVSSVIGIAMLVSVASRRPLMSAGLKPFLTKGDPAKIRAWDDLTMHSAEFQRCELRFTLVWACSLLADCIARFIGAFTLPVATMMWLSTFILIGSIGFACILGGVVSKPMEKLIGDEAARNHAA